MTAALLDDSQVDLKAVEMVVMLVVDSVAKTVVMMVGQLVAIWAVHWVGN